MTKSISNLALLFVFIVSCGGEPAPNDGARSVSTASTCDTAASLDDCDAMSECEPACLGLCDCTCPGPQADQEGCGCEECPASCFGFAECVSLPEPDNCTLGHTSCMAGDANCWDFGAPAGLAFSGLYVSECDESNTDCGSTLICAVDNFCGSDAPCPGLCVASMCLL